VAFFLYLLHRSPIISGFSELVVGITTVRAFGSEKRFLSNMYKRLDRTQAALHYCKLPIFYHQELAQAAYKTLILSLDWACNRWLGFRLQLLGAITVLIVTVGALLVGAQAGLVGIVVAQVGLLDVAVPEWAVRLASCADLFYLGSTICRVSIFGATFLDGTGTVT